MEKTPKKQAAKKPAAKKAAAKGLAPKNPVKKKRQRRPGFVVWISHAGREIILDDLINEHVPMTMSAEEAWEVYKKDPHFEDVCFQQFKLRFADHKKQVDAKLRVSHMEAYMLAEDRNKIPRKTHNARGEPVFDLDEKAKTYLRADIKAKCHEIFEAF